MTTTTVLVPAYKAATFIGDTIAALRSQTFPSFDVIVSIDGPDEETQIVCRQLTASDSRFRIITQPMRLGWVGNVNALLKQVASEYFCILPHDDIPDPSYLCELHRALEQRPEAVAAFCDIAEFGMWDTSYFNESADSADLSRRVLPFLETEIRAVPFRALTRTSVLARGQRLEDAGYDGFAADVCWCLRLFCLGPCIRVPKPLYRKRIWAGSVVRGWDKFSADEKAAALVTHTSQCARILCEFTSGSELQALIYALIVRLLRAYRTGVDAYGRGAHPRHEDIALVAALMSSMADPSMRQGAGIAELRKADYLLGLTAPLAYHDGLWAMRSKEWSRAAEHFAEAIALRPGDSEAQRLLAVALGHQHRTSESLAVIEAALKLDPSSPEVLATAIDLYFHAGRYVEAEQAARRAVELHPARAELRIALSNVLAAIGRWSEALQSARRAIELAPDDRRAAENLERMRIASPKETT